MKIKYYPETDSLVILLKEEYRGPGEAEDLTSHGNVTAHYSADEELVALEVDGRASELFDASEVGSWIVGDDGEHLFGVTTLKGATNLKILKSANSDPE